MYHKLLGIRIDYVKTYQAVETVEKWLRKRGKHIVVTPNPEMLVDADFDSSFKAALNHSDMAIPDSLRLGWGSYISAQKNLFLRLIFSPFFLFPHLLPRFHFPTASGVGLMEALLSLSEKKGFTTAYLGGSNKVAEKLHECLKAKYPKLKIAFCSGNVLINQEGDMQFDTQNINMTESKEIRIGVRDKGQVLRENNEFNLHSLSEKIDIMFVAFGHIKQEKWMQKNLPKLNTRVMMGVGGAFDYLSGTTPRAPIWMQNFGLEWLFRLIVQPWRIKRFWKLPVFVYKVVTTKQ